jgi:hypothetical protein
MMRRVARPAASTAADTIVPPRRITGMPTRGESLIGDVVIFALLSSFRYTVSLM